MIVLLEGLQVLSPPLVKQSFFEDLKASIARGTVMASFNCESFSVESLVDLTQDEVSERLEEFFN